MSRLKFAGVKTSEKEEKENIGTKFKDMAFVLTGTLPTLSRSEATELIENEGGRVTGSVSSKTDYLLAGENVGSKYDRAVSLDIPILSENDLLALLKENEERT